MSHQAVVQFLEHYIQCPYPQGQEEGILLSFRAANGAVPDRYQVTLTSGCGAVTCTKKLTRATGTVDDDPTADERRSETRGHYPYYHQIGANRLYQLDAELLKVATHHTPHPEVSLVTCMLNTPLTAGVRGLNPTGAFEQSRDGGRWWYATRAKMTPPPPIAIFRERLLLANGMAGMQEKIERQAPERVAPIVDKKCSESL